jgi:signal transduction histidine kinase
VAEDRLGRASVRVRTTVAAVVVVAVALMLGAFLLVSMLRGALQEGLETTAEERASSIADQVQTSGLPAQPAPGAEADEDGDEDDEPDDLVWQVTDSSGEVVRASQTLGRTLPLEDSDRVELPGGEHDYVVVAEGVRWNDQGYVVSVAVSREEIDDSTSALVPLLLVGVPLVLLVVGGTTWMVATRALAPVERIRREVQQISGQRLDRRVHEPRSRDEVHRLAQTMNQMLDRLQSSADRQQQFVADASHELRSPLASIRQTAEVSRAHPGALPEGELADAVLEESLRMQRLVEQLLLLTRADEGAVLRSPRDVDLDDLLVTEARRVTRSGLTVDTSGVRTGRVRGDETALGQVVRNLVDNAARHARSRVTLGLRESGDEVELSVEDDGTGVPEPQRERVFERFVRLDDARARDAGGSGLGLAIVAEIVRAHGGSVAVSESASGGARFVVRLPAEDPETAS